MESPTVTLFTLTGMNESRSNKHIIFAFSLQGYFMTLFLNLTVITVVSLEKDLHQPMYIFLCNLCVNGLYGTAGFYPKFLSDLLYDSHVISYSQCLLQTFVIFSYTMSELTNLTVMAIDRYMAICRPLHYHTIMTPMMTGKLLVFIWMLPCCSVMCSILLALKLPFCGSTDSLYCKFTVSTCRAEIVGFSFNGIFASMYLLLIAFVIYSYGKILSACKKSKKNQYKFLQTCVPHLISCLNYVFSSICDAFHIFLDSNCVPRWFKNVMSLIFIVTPPIINPLIYGLILSPIRTSIIKILR